MTDPRGSTLTRPGPKPFTWERTGSKFSTKYIYYVLVLFVIVQALAPVLWMLGNSHRTREEFYRDPWGLPTAFRWEHYGQAWREARVGEFALNSVFIVSAALLIMLVAASLTAYALSRFSFRGRGFVFGVILATMMVPPDILVVPLFIILRDLGLLGTRIALSLVYASGGFAFSVLLLRAYFMSVPPELEDAASVDGAGRLRIFFYVILPLSLSGFLTVTIVQLVTFYNDLYLAFVFLRRPDHYTVPVGMLAFFERFGINWPIFFAGLIITLAPIAIIFLVAQKWFVEGLRSGALKG